MARPVFGIPAAVRYAVPLVLLVLVGVYLGFNAFYGNKQANVPAVAESAPPVAAPVIESPSNNVISPPVNPTTEEHVAVRKPETASNSVGDKHVKKQPNVERPGGGTYIEAVRQERKLYPRGFNPDARPPANSKMPDRAVQIPTKDVLNLFGVKGTFGESGWKVESVGADTLAARSGVKTGDVIEAINDQVLTEKMSFKGRFNGKTLRVRRDGTSIQIILKN